MMSGKADSRLTEESSGGRGCGGVGVLWHKSFGATVVSGILSDRICAIRLRNDDGDRSQLTVIGVYLPSVAYPGGCFGCSSTPLNDRIHSFVSAMARILYTRRSRHR